MPSLAIVNASDRSDGITQDIKPYFERLSRSGYSVKWYQCVDYHGVPYVPEGGITVHGLGFPSRLLDMGINRLWVFPHRLHQLSEETVLLADPTLARIAPSTDRLIAKVHDVRPLTRYSDHFSTRLMFRNVLPRLKRLPRVIVPSTFVQQELVGLSFDPSIIRVVPETHQLGYHPEHVERLLDRVRNRKETRVLYVGADRPYKNIELVLEVARQMERRDGHQYTFTFVSRFREQTRQRCADLGLKNVRVLSDVESMSSIYEESDLLVFPSLYEGFGRPLIEAMAYGLPIVANRIEPVVEVVGDGGILLDAPDADVWAEALSSLEDLEMLEFFARKSLDRSKAFTPERFEEALFKALRSM
jgi:glycosyltransferase involved in cell wall biosynthesis